MSEREGVVLENLAVSWGAGAFPAELRGLGQRAGVALPVLAALRAVERAERPGPLQGWKYEAFTEAWSLGSL